MQINPTYLRVGFYLLAPMLASVPGVSVDMMAGVVTIDIDTLLGGIAIGIAAGAGVFAKWGKK